MEGYFKTADRIYGVDRGKDGQTTICEAEIVGGVLYVHDIVRLK